MSTNLGRLCLSQGGTVIATALVLNYAPINALQLLAVESCVLFSAFAGAFLVIHFVRSCVAQPRILTVILSRNYRRVLLVIAIALVARALLLPILGIPQPRINDEYSNLLMADTFSHYRLTNPTPASWEHFETFHVNLTPTYHSKYPVAQGLALALGKIVFHQPWIGVYLSTAALCGAICWTLQAFLPPAWALLGGLMAAVRIALFSYWMNSYWGGSMAALGGALALGAVVRLFEPNRTNRNRMLLAALFAVSLLVLANSRPYEGLAFSLPLLMYFGCQVRRAALPQKEKLHSTLLPVALIGLAGLSLMGYYNRKTTGGPLLLPHILNERTYSPLPLFLWQRPKGPITYRDPVFTRFYALTEQEYGYRETRSLAGLVSVEVRRALAGWFFYIGPALSFPFLLGLLLSATQARLRIVVFAALSTTVALALCIYSMPHYAAPATVTGYLFAVQGLRLLWRRGKDGERAFVVAVCLTVTVTALTRQTGSTAINANFALPDTRSHILRQLEEKPGNHLVLVSYDLARHYPGNELVHNGAELASEKVLWARSKGASRDRELCDAYSGRTFWRLKTDDQTSVLELSELCKYQETRHLYQNHKADVPDLTQP